MKKRSSARMVLHLFIVSTMLVRIMHAGEDLVIHEWGTFTSFQDERGNAFGYINAADEDLPSFTHNAIPMLYTGAPARSKGLPQCHPDITMRLETPVLYFHLPEGSPRPIQLDVRVRFLGGWLTQFYPNAVATIPSHGGKPTHYGELSGQTVGMLEWQGLKVGVDQAGPETTSHVWLAPREVAADYVMTAQGEAEKYLFYRGVGHLDSPLRVARSSETESNLLIRGTPSNSFSLDAPMVVKHLWLVDIRPDGQVAWRKLDSIELQPGSDNILTTTPFAFTEEEFVESYDEETAALGVSGNLATLQNDMLGALIEDGLFKDEANALLATWELSYFQSWGMRLFFIVPKPWTDHYLPLEVSIPAHIERVMMGRIEIVRPAQRSLIHGLAASLKFRPSDQLRSEQQIFDSMAIQQLEALGRFGRVLLLDESLKHPANVLNRFMSAQGLAAYQHKESFDSPR